MRKFIAAIFAFAALFSLASCNLIEKPIKVALMVSEPGMFESNPFYIQAWDSIVSYCKDRDISYKEYISDYRTVSQLQIIVDEAIKKGAEIIICPGYYFQEVVLESQKKYQDVNFVLIDCVPNNGLSGADYYEETDENTIPVLFDEAQNGFLAGYAMVMDGHRDLGFIGGMPVPAVIRDGYGYIQGAEYAAKQLDLPEGAVNVHYVYSGSFLATPEAQAKAERWYSQGTEVIFACGGAITLSVTAAAAEMSEKYAIGIDVDESGISERVVTSVLKHVDRATADALAAHFEGDFPGGEPMQMTISNDGIGLEMENSRFKTFDEAAYKEITDILKQDKDGIATGLIKDDAAIEDIKLDCVRLQLEGMN